MKLFNIFTDYKFDKKYVKYLRKHIYRHWWNKRHKIDQKFLNHINRKHNVNCTIISDPENTDEEFIWGKILVNNKKIKSYIKLFNYNGYKVNLVDNNMNIIDEFNNGLI